MNILIYDPKAIKLPDPMDSDSDENVELGVNEGNEQRSHFISIKYDERFKKGQYIDIYASLFSDFTSKIIVHLNEK
jgi:hypothetical protein